MTVETEDSINLVKIKVKTDDAEALERWLEGDVYKRQLVNKTGELVGINTAIVSQTGAYSGYSCLLYTSPGWM